MKQKKGNNKIKQRKIKAESFKMAFHQLLAGSKAHRTRKAKAEAALSLSQVHTWLLSIFSPVSLKILGAISNTDKDDDKAKQPCHLL